MPLEALPTLATTLDGRPSRRLWLLAPYALVLILLVGWSAGWFVVKQGVERRLDAATERLTSADWKVELRERRVEGFPFRLKVSWSRARLATPSGWAVDVPGLKAEAYLHAPDHWVLAAPAGLTFVRPRGGAVAVSGQALRASLSGLRGPAWRLVLEGVKPRFAPPSEANPFSLASADLVQLYLQPSPATGELRSLVRVENGRAGPRTLLGLLASDKPVTLRTEARVTHVSAWRGGRLAQAGRAWAEAGGALRLDRSELQAGAVSARLAGPTTLAVDDAGRLRGVLPIEVRPALATLGALVGIELDPGAAAGALDALSGREAGDAGRLTLTLRDGEAKLGPLRIGSAPKLF